MTTLTRPREVERSPDTPRTPDTAGRDRAGRGTTTIADRVVVRIVERTVAETEEAGGLDSRLRRGRAVDADVEVAGDVVTVRVRMSVAYPTPVRPVADRVRERVRERVGALTGLSVRQVDIDVTELEPPGRARREVT